MHKTVLIGYRSPEATDELVWAGLWAHRDFARSQVNYMLGDNRYGTSFMIGYGDKWWPTAHHRGVRPDSFFASNLK